MLNHLDIITTLNTSIWQTCRPNRKFEKMERCFYATCLKPI